MTKEETQIERIMKGLKCSEEEAREIYRADKEIDQGKRQDFDLSPEEEKAAKKYLRTGTRKTPTNYKFDKKTRKENPTKAGLIALVAENLQNSDIAADVQVTNKEREILFTMDGQWYSLTLTCKRNMNKEKGGG